MLSKHRSVKIREASSIADVDSNIEDRKYEELRMYSELSNIYENMNVRKVKTSKPKYKQTLHYLVSKSREFNSDKMVVRSATSMRLVTANNRLALNKKQFDSCFQDLFRFISHLTTVSKYGIFIDGVGLIKCNGSDLMFDPFYKVGVGNAFDNMILVTGGEMKREISKKFNAGQEYNTEDDVIGIFTEFNRKVLPKINLNHIDFKKIKEEVALRSFKKHL